MRVPMSMHTMLCLAPLHADRCLGAATSFVGGGRLRATCNRTAGRDCAPGRVGRMYCTNANIAAYFTIVSAMNVARACQAGYVNDSTAPSLASFSARCVAAWHHLITIRAPPTCNCQVSGTSSHLIQLQQRICAFNCLLFSYKLNQHDLNSMENAAASACQVHHWS